MCSAAMCTMTSCWSGVDIYTSDKDGWPIILLWRNLILVLGVLSSVLYDFQNSTQFIGPHSHNVWWQVNQIGSALIEQLCGQSPLSGGCGGLIQLLKHGPSCRHTADPSWGQPAPLGEGVKGLGGISIENCTFLCVFCTFCAFQQNSKKSLTNQNNTRICHKLKSNGSFDNYKSRTFQIRPYILSVSVCRWVKFDL